MLEFFNQSDQLVSKFGGEMVCCALLCIVAVSVLLVLLLTLVFAFCKVSAVTSLLIVQPACMSRYL